MKCNYSRLFAKIYIFLCLTAIIRNQPAETSSTTDNIFSNPTGQSNQTISDEPSSVTLCEVTENCIANLIIESRTKICAERENCDKTCLTNKINFDDCIKTCKCNPGDAFSRTCFNRCKTNTWQSKLPFFKNFADCLYETCVLPAPSKSILLFIIIAAVVFICLVVFSVRRYLIRRRKALENNAANIQSTEWRGSVNNTVNNLEKPIIN